MSRTIEIAGKTVGEGHPVYLIAEIGINHNGDIDTAKKLIDVAVSTGFDAVKFQKRTPEICVPIDQQKKMRETPWGYISYLDYKKKIEFEEEEFKIVDSYCREKNITWFASPWDEPSVDFMEGFDTPAYKIPSALLTDGDLLRKVRTTNKPVILSTGMSSMEQIRMAVDILGTDHLAITHCTSAYPCEPSELNLRMIETLRKEFSCGIGYSGHEVGLQSSLAAVALGAVCLERHITLDRSMWGTDQSASVEPPGMKRLVRSVRVIEESLGDGIKKVYPSELPIMEKLRRNDTLEPQKASGS